MAKSFSIEQTTEFAPVESTPSDGTRNDASKESALKQQRVANEASRMSGAGKFGFESGSIEDNRNVGLIQASQSMTEESLSLLRQRLKIASILFACGYVAFLIFGIALPRAGMALSGQVLFTIHIATMVVTVVVAVRLCMHCEIVNRYIRTTEFVVFGSAALFFAVLSFVQTQTTLSRGFVRPAVEPWLILISAYSILIPNSWQRATTIITPIAFAPSLILPLAYWTADGTEELTANNGESLGLEFLGVWIATTLMMSLGAAIGIWGVHSIRGLRKQAFEARQMGQYKLKDRLGSGGMGEVYLAEHLMLKRPCAIKLIRPEKAGNPANLKRFEREVRATATLSHWNSVDVFDYGRADDGTFYYVMEYLPGLNIQQLVEAGGPIPSSRIIHLMRQVCDALFESHGKGLIHRDIKPANVFAAQRGGVYDVAKLLDFGLVLSMSTSQDAALTQDGAIQGSPLYLSPEQAIGEKSDERSDIYSLGAVMYYMMTGVPPFDHINPLKVIMAHAKDEPRKPSEFNANIDGQLESVVLKCLAKAPEDRYQDVVELKDALMTCQAAGQWTDQEADQWWNCNGCPQKKQLDQTVLKYSRTA